MRKLLLIVPQLLLIGLAWGQVDLDKLVLKDGTTYFGEYSKIEGKIVYFKPHDAFGFQPITFNTIHKLELANGLKLVTNGKIEQDRLVLKDGQIIIGDGKNSLTLEENQKLSTKAKVIIGCGCIIVVFIILGSGGGGGFDMSGFDYDACFDPNCG